MYKVYVQCIHGPLVIFLWSPVWETSILWVRKCQFALEFFFLTSRVKGFALSWGILVFAHEFAYYHFKNNV